MSDPEDPTCDDEITLVTRPGFHAVVLALAGTEPEEWPALEEDA